MAVYTTLDFKTLADFVSRFDLPALSSVKAASDGVENTTYFLTLADQNQWVLTVFETLAAHELPFYITLLGHLHQSGLPVPCPLNDSKQQALQTLADKPALLFPRAKGQHRDTNTAPSPADCRLIGAELARLHLAGKHFDTPHANPRGLDWLQHCLGFVAGSISPNDHQLITATIKQFENLSAATRSSAPSATLPSGIIHGDLFRDNVLFDGDNISALIDFYNAGHDVLLLDVAITFNDWCLNPQAQVLPANAEAFLDAYQNLRPFTAAETAAWQQMLQVAACRFWLSRLKAVELHRQGQTQTLKDPDYYRQVLLQHSINENSSHL